MSLQKSSVFASRAAGAAWTATAATAMATVRTAARVSRLSIGALLSRVSRLFHTDEALKTGCCPVQMRDECFGRVAGLAAAERVDDPPVLRHLRRLVVPVELEERQSQLALRALVGGGESAAAEGRDEDPVEEEVALECLGELHLAQAGTRLEPALEDELAQHPLGPRAGRRAIESGDESLGAQVSSDSTSAIRSSAAPRNAGSNPTVRRKWPSHPIIEPGMTSTD